MKNNVQIKPRPTVWKRTLRCACAGLFVAGLFGAVNAQTILSADEVRRVVGQAVAEAKARNVAATIAVVDRPGNVLAVYQMNGAAENVTVTSNRGIAQGNGLEQQPVPASFAAIAKAITGNYLSSGGNSFSTRVASQIVQEHFNPGEFNQPAGPLFGVQFSQLQCSEVTSEVGSQGPKGSPLGLSADPGGFPLYRGGQVIGGVGVIADGLYSLDNSISDIDQSIDELVALAATRGFGAPEVLSQITLDGKLVRFSDAEHKDLRTSSVDSLAGGRFVPVAGFFTGSVKAGVAFGSIQSGFVVSDAFGVPAVVLGDRFPIRAGTDAAALTENEVRVLISNALRVAMRARAQIRNPADSGARVSISVVDSNGIILGIARTPDAPIFGTDVSLQKARTAAFFSRADAGQKLIDAGQQHFVNALRSFVSPTALADGIAFSDRAGGNLSRPFYPDGIDGNPNGPLSFPFEVWSPFNVGLQFNLIGIDRLISAAPGCTSIPNLANGIQIFPGSVPIYRGGQLIGGIGVSGDGVDQDDMISFLGLHNAGVELGGAINNADPAIRADTLSPQGVRLRYINCPQAPFIDSIEASPCAGK
ncbi:GlcG/HbpS family heme-binding protein [Arenicella xantha]|nr:heme-binding protein [Arenicella xantha]